MRMLAMGAAVLLLIGSIVAQQTTDPNQALNDEKARLQLQKDIEELKKDINQDRLDRVKASIGSISTTGLPTGSATLTNVDIQATIIGYASVTRSMDRVVTDLYTDPATATFACPTKVVMRASGLDDVALLDTHIALIVSATDQINDILKPGRTEFVAPAMVFSAVDAVVALGSLFKSDVTIQGVSITSDEEAARYIFIRSLASRCRSAVVIDPNGFAGPLAMADSSPLLKAVARLNDASDQLTAATAALQDQLPYLEQKVTALDKQLQALDQVHADIAKTAVLLAGATGDDKRKFEAQLREQKSQAAALETEATPAMLVAAKVNLARLKQQAAIRNALIARVAALNTVLNKTDDAGTPFLLRLRRAETLAGFTRGEPILSLGLVKIGGNNTTKKGVFHTSIKYAGGAVIKFELREPDSLTVRRAGEEDAYEYKEEDAKLGSVQKNNEQKRAQDPKKK